jgi:uncharacterized spore protein YtfJ
MDTQLRERESEVRDTLEQMKETASVRNVVGEPVVSGDRTIIPLARVTHAYGFGYGSGSSRGSSNASGGGGGGGGRSAARPVAVVEVTPQGTRVEPIVDVTRTAIFGIALAAWASFWLFATVRRFARR